MRVKIYHKFPHPAEPEPTPQPVVEDVAVVKLVEEKPGRTRKAKEVDTVEGDNV